MLAAGCANSQNDHTSIVLQNPTTKQTKECKGLDPGHANIYDNVEACAEAYEKAGYVRVSAY